MSDRPIIFSGPMVRTILAGRKTQTRRVLKPQPYYRGGYGHTEDPDEWGWMDDDGQHVTVTEIVPNGFRVGDRLWVREAWNITHRQHLAPGEDIERSAEDCVAANGGFACACADGVVYQATAAQSHPEYGKALWRPSIHMPRWASRLTLIVEDVLVQRLQEISEADAEAEGVDPILVPPDGGGIPHVEGFRETWDSLNAGRSSGCSWSDNPWVAALTFRAIQKNIDEVKAND